MEEGITGSQADPDATALISPDTDAAASGPAPAIDTIDPGIGTSQGRYVVLEILGRGAMGRVLRAYDPKLEREVALKLVSGQTLDPNARERMLREARAMAQLSHPNVVAVYDAEESDAGVVLVMEYVRGQTLRPWTRASAHPWAEVVARFVAAGRGLAAAHAVGLLHRDFKPDNVLVAESGAVKVTDFGLAKLAATGSRSRAGGGLDGSSSASFERSSSGWFERSSSGSSGLLEAASSGSSGTLDMVLTRVGTVMGTPRYMAPEQHRGEPLGPAADQYAFCVSLWEALVGQPPHHRATTLRELLDEKLLEPPAWPSGAPGLPRPLVDALRRGLAAEPSARWPSMDALLAALTHDPHRRRNRWLVGAGALALVAAVAAGWWSWSAARARQCTGAREHLAGVWDDTRRAAVSAAMLEVGASYAGPVWERTRTELDRYADEWAQMHTEACEATTLRGEQSTEVMDLRMGCLHRAKLGLEAVTQVLASADAEVTRNASDVVGSLGGLDRCADVEALRAEVEPPRADEADAVEGIRKQVAAATAELEAGRYDRALATLEAAKTSSAAVEYGPVRTELALEEGIVLQHLGRYEASEAVLRAALESAARWHQWGLLQEVAAELMFVVGYEQRRMEEGRQLWELAVGLAGADAKAEASARNVFADVLSAEGRLSEAEAEYRRALALREAALGPDDPDIAVSRSNLGLVLDAQGKHEEAEAEFRRALAMMEQALGPLHPATAVFRNNLANTLTAQGEYAEAEAELRQALVVMEEALGPEHPDVALSLSNLAQILIAEGKYPEAEALHRRALAVRERLLAPDHPEIGSSRNNLANLLHAQGRFGEAEVELRRALPQLEAVLGPEHADVAQLRSNLGLILYAQGRDEEAETELRRALVLWEKALGPEHSNVGLARNNVALVLYANGRYTDAEVEYRGALALQEKALGPDHPNVATTRSNLGQVLLARGELEEAEAEQRRALGVEERVLGPEHPDVARSHNNLGQILLARGAHAEAEAELSLALALWEQALGSEHPNVATARHNLAKLLLVRGRPAEALVFAEQAFGRRERDDALPEQRAATAFVLARALWSTSRGGAARARARALAERAVQGFEAAGKAKEADEVRAWSRRPEGWLALPSTRVRKDDPRGP
jgi:tetratricopeptide (TPR) repeat protein